MVTRCKKLIEKLMHEMAYSRGTWVDRVRDKILSGALGEYGKLVISREIDELDSWSNEVTTLLSKLDNFMDESKIKGKSKFDRVVAFKEAVFEASQEQKQITDAKNEMVKYFPDKRRDILKLKLDSESLLPKMLEEFKNKYFKLL